MHLQPNGHAHEHHRETAFLGRGHGHAWYMHAPIYIWIHLRELSGRNIPPALLAAEQTIRTRGYGEGSPKAQAEVDKAVRQILAVGDPEAAAMIGLSLAVAVTKGSFQRANEAGIRVLRQLPGDVGRDLVKRVLRSCKHEHQQRKLREVAATLSLG